MYFIIGVSWLFCFFDHAILFSSASLQLFPHQLIHLLYAAIYGFFSGRNFHSLALCFSPRPGSIQISIRCIGFLFFPPHLYTSSFCFYLFQNIQESKKRVIDYPIFPKLVFLKSNSYQIFLFH